MSDGQGDVKKRIASFDKVFTKKIDNKLDYKGRKPADKEDKNAGDSKKASEGVPAKKQKSDIPPLHYK